MWAYYCCPKYYLLLSPRAYCYLWLTVFIIASLFAGYGDVPVWLTCNGELVADCGDFELDSASSFRVIHTTELWNILLTFLVNIHVTCWSKEKIAFTQTIKHISYINSKLIFLYEFSALNCKDKYIRKVKIYCFTIMIHGLLIKNITHYKAYSKIF